MDKTSSTAEMEQIRPVYQSPCILKETGALTKPLVPVDPSKSSQRIHHYQHRDHAFISHLSSPEAAESLSGSSTAYFSQPNSPAHSVRHPPRTKSESTQGEESNTRGSRPPSTVANGRNAGNHRSWPGPVPPPTTRQAEEDLTYTYDEDNDVEPIPRRLEDKVPQILLYLSITAPLISALFSFYTAFAVLGIVLASPLRLCISRPSLQSQIINIISPLHRFQLSQIYSEGLSLQYSATSFVLIHLSLPVVAIGFAVAAWVAGSFWAYAAILGDPDGRGRSNDGARTVLTVRAWWEGLLYKVYHS